VTTYNLDYSNLNSQVLSNLKSPLEQSVIDYSLSQFAKNFTTGATPTITEVATLTAGPVLLGSQELFVYAGASGTTAQVLSAGGNLLLDPGNINDFNYGSSDTLVGGDFGDNDTCAGGGSVLTSETGNNVLIGDTGYNTLVGGSGNDTMWGGGATSMVAGSGNDILHGYEGAFPNSADTLIGGVGASVLSVTQGNNLLVGSFGLNTLLGGSGDDTMWGGTQTSMVGGNGPGITTMFGDVDTVASALASHDTLTGGSGSALMITDQGTNTFNLGSGNALIYSGGQDTINANLAAAGSATIYGGVDGKTTTVNITDAAAITKDTIVGGATEITFTSGSSSHQLTIYNSTIEGLPKV